MKTPRELILERHQSAEARLKSIRAEDLAAYAKPDRDLWSAPVRFWQEALWPWRRVWIGIAATWVFILAFSLADGESPRAVTAKPSRPDPEALAVLQEQKELLTQLLGPGAAPQVSRLRTQGPRSEAEPPRLGVRTAPALLNPEGIAAFSVIRMSKCAGDLSHTPHKLPPETSAQA